MRILIAWCHGGNWGHVSRQLALAGHARKLGAEVIWAVPASKANAMGPVRALGHRVLVSAAAQSESRTQSTPRCFADILLGIGFAEPPTLEAQTIAWMRLYGQVRPDRVVIDYAPAAQLAALLQGLPAVQLTNGFDSPPAHCPPYESRLRGPYLRQHAAARVQQVERNLSNVARRIEPDARTTLKELIEYPQRLVDSVAECDPYAAHREASTTRVAYVGPLGHVPNAHAPLWPSPLRTPSQRVFAYLRGPNPQFASALMSLQEGGASILCVWPDAPGQVLCRLSAVERLRITQKPVQAAAAIAQADAVVNYGSSTVVAQTLLAGKPQLMLPTDHEKRLVGACVADGGMGALCDADASAEQLRAAALHFCANVAAMTSAAQAVAARHTTLPKQAAAAIREALTEA